MTKIHRTQKILVHIHR